MDRLTERMQETVDGSFEDVDAVLLVVAARERIGAATGSSHAASSRSADP